MFKSLHLLLDCRGKSSLNSVTEAAHFVNIPHLFKFQLWAVKGGLLDLLMHLGKNGNRAEHDCKLHPTAWNKSSNCKLSGQGGGFNSTPMTRKAWLSTLNSTLPEQPTKRGKAHLILAWSPRWIYHESAIIGKLDIMQYDGEVGDPQRPGGRAPTVTLRYP